LTLGLARGERLKELLNVATIANQVFKFDYP
jgi:hypothetical protein